MAERLMHDSVAAERLRMLLRAAEDVKTPAATAEGTTSETMKKVDEKLAKEKPSSFGSDVVKAGKAAIKAGPNAIGDIGVGLVKSLEGLANAKTADEGIQHVRDLVLGAGTLPISPLIAVGSAIGAWTKSLAPGAQAFEDGSVVRTLMGGHPGHVSDAQYSRMSDEEKAKYSDKQREFHAPMSLAEFTQNAVPVLLGGAIHGSEATKAGKAAVPEAKKSAAESKFDAAVAKGKEGGAPPAAAATSAEPPAAGPFPRTGTAKEKAAWNDAQKARFQWEKSQKAAEAKPAEQPAAEKPAVEQPAAEVPAEAAPVEGAPAAAEATGPLTPEEIHQSVVENGGATVDPRTGQLHPGDSGFVVSQPGEMNTPLAEFTPQHVADFAAANAERLAQPDAYHGAWVNGDTVTQDVSNIIPDQQKAIALGLKNNQKAIFDLGNKSEITLNPAPVKFRGMQETSKGGATPPMELWDLTDDIEGHPKGSTLSRGTLQDKGYHVPDVPVTDPVAAEAALAGPAEIAPAPATVETLPTEEAPAVDPAQQQQASTGEQKDLSPLEMDPMQGTEGAGITPSADPASIPDPALEGTEAAGAPAIAPQPAKTVADIHALVQPVAEIASKTLKNTVQQEVDAKRTEAQVREEANQMAAEMRAQGKTRQEINEAYRAKLNEAGIKSKRQKAAEPPKPGAPAVDEGNNETPKPVPPVEEDFNLALARIKKRVGEMLDLTSEEGKVQLRGSITEGLRKNSETYNDLKIIGAGLLHYGARDFNAWSEAMRSTLAESGHDVTNLDPYLKDLYPLAQKQLKVFNQTKYDRDLPSLVELKDAAQRGEPGYEWYDKAPQELKARFGENADLFAGTYAATSPLQDAATTNIDLAMRAYNQITAGERDGIKRKFTPRKDGIMPVVADNLNRVARGELVSGPKIGVFEGQLRQDAFTSGARDIPVIDTWMFRLFGFMPDDPSSAPSAKGLPAQRTFMETLIHQMAQETGSDVAQVQASLWVDVKASVERRRATEAAEARAKKSGDVDGEMAKLSDELKKINEGAGTPLDQLLRNRLGPIVESIRQGDMTGNGDALVSRRASAAILKHASDPEAAITTSLQRLGMEEQHAASVAATTVDALKQAGMDDGAGGIDLGHPEDAAITPFDRVAAETAISERLKGLCP